MSDQPENIISRELADAEVRHAVSLGDMKLPLDVAIRSIALTIAQRHCGDTTVKEGNLYQQLKMDNKLVGPLTVEHVVKTALVFEAFLWGQYSKDLAGNAMGDALDEMDAALKARMKPHMDDDPTRPHAGGQE